MMEKIKSLTKKQKIILLASGMALITIIVIVCSIVAADQNKVDLADTYTITVEGLNTQGTASCEINKKSIEAALLGKKIDIFRADMFAESVKCNLNKKENLKNGDKVTAQLTYDEAVAKQLNLSFKNTEKEINVSGLAKGREVDVFQNIQVSFTGTSPDGEVSIVNKSTDPFVSKVTFSPVEEKVANGDKVTIKAVYDNQEAISQKVIVKKESKEYAVSNLPEYLKNSKQLSGNNIKTLNSLAEKEIQKFFDHNTLIFPSMDIFEDHHTTYKNLKHKEYMLVTPKDDNSYFCGAPSYNSYLLISSADVYDNGKKVAPTYLVTSIPDVIISTDKNVQGKTENPNDYDTIDEAQKAIEDKYSKYNIEKVNLNQ